MTTETAQRRLDIEAAKARALLAAIAGDAEGDEEIVQSTIEGETNVLEAIDKGLARILELDGFQAALKAEEKAVAGRMKERRERFERQEESVRAAILDAIVTLGLQKQERTLGTVGTAKVPDKLVITAEAEIPEDFWKTDPVLDKALLTAAVKDYRAAFEGLWPTLLTQHGGDEAKAKAAAAEALKEKAVPGAHMQPQPNRLNLRFA